MYHLHFNEIDSTQIYLKDHLPDILSREFTNQILITSSKQTSGIGRKGHKWEHANKSLAMSFVVLPNKTPSLSPIEIGLLVSEFFKTKFQKEILIKWPNDLMTLNGKKCGGIISQLVHHQDKDFIIVGLGLNLGNIQNVQQENFKHGIESLDLNIESEKQIQELSKEIYQFILSNRINHFNSLSKLFEQKCIHLNKKVELEDDSEKNIGYFLGIGPSGEARIQINNDFKYFYSSSLKILNE